MRGVLVKLDSSLGEQWDVSQRIAMTIPTGPSEPKLGCTALVRITGMITVKKTIAAAMAKSLTPLARIFAIFLRIGMVLSFRIGWTLRVD